MSFMKKKPECFCCLNLPSLGPVWLLVRILVSNNANSTHLRPLSYSDVMGSLSGGTWLSLGPPGAFHHHLALPVCPRHPQTTSPLRPSWGWCTSLPPEPPCGDTLRALLSLDSLLVGNPSPELANGPSAGIYMERGWAQKAENLHMFSFFSL